MTLSCDNGGVSSVNTVKIIKGQDITFTLKFLLDSSQDPFDFTGVSSISAQFLQADNTAMNKTLSSGVAVVDPALLGKLQITLSAADTALLKEGKTTCEVTIVKSSKTYIVQFVKAINALSSSF